MERADNRNSLVSRHGTNYSPERKNEESDSMPDQSNDDQQSPLIPPHWLHRRHESYASVIDNKPPPIILLDHTEPSSEHHGAVWAKAIYIEDYVIVSGSVPSVGSFVVWHCKIETLDGGSMILRKRYSEFYELRQKLLMTFTGSEGAMPPFPPKSLICEQHWICMQQKLHRAKWNAQIDFAHRSWKKEE